MANAIEIKELRKEFGKKIAVNNISFTVEEGKLFSLLGVNGAGKTTTIRILCGLSQPTAGGAKLLGHDVVTDRDSVKRETNLSPQDTAIAPNLTVRENLIFIAGIYGFDSSRAKQKANEVIAQFGLEKEENTKARTLSGGWQRRLSIAMALITEPKILFLDEPTLGLDVLARRELWKIIRDLKGKITIVLTTHYMEEAEELSDEVAVMVDGEVRALGTVEQLKEQTQAKTLEEAFVAIAEGGIDHE